MGLLYGIGIRLMNFMIFFLIIILLPLPPKTHFAFKSFDVTPAKELKGSLELNNILDNAERLLEGRVYGPECLIARRNEVYTGIHGGEVIKITADHITHVAKFGQPCEGIYEESKCGRPLGLAFDTIGNNLIVADAYYGIWEVDLSNGKKKLLISPNQEFDGKIKRQAKIFNSIAVDKRGDIYWSDSSSDFTIEDGVLASLTNPSGRLFHYDRSMNVSKMLIDELSFVNGIALSPNEDFLVYAETGASRLTKYYIKGSKRGQHEIFLDGLPGLPDNLTPDSDGLWVPLIIARDSDNPQLFQILAPFPLIRTFIVRFLVALEMPFRFVNNAFPNVFTQKVIHVIGHFESGLNFILPKRVTILRVDWNGNILGSLHGFDKSVGAVSHVLELDDSLLLGSPFNKFVAKVKLPKTPQMKIRNVRHEGAGEYMEPIVVQKKVEPNVEAQKPKISTTTTTTTTTTKKPTTTPRPSTTTTPKPTTTTPKPTTTTPKPTTTTTTTKRPTSTTTTTPKPITAKPVVEKPVTTPPKPTVAPKQQSIPSTTTTPTPTTVNPKAKKDPAPIIEEIRKDTHPPKQEKLKVIKKGGVHDEF